MAILQTNFLMVSQLSLCSTSLLKYLKEKKDKGKLPLFSHNSKVEVLRDVVLQV